MSTAKTTSSGMLTHFNHHLLIINLMIALLLIFLAWNFCKKAMGNSFQWELGAWRQKNQKTKKVMGNMQNVVYGQLIPVITTAEALPKPPILTFCYLLAFNWQCFGSGNNWQGSSKYYILHVSHSLLRLFLSNSQTFQLLSTHNP